ncbi:MAG: HPr family phosphocarrier protein [Pseudomonadaceae bacterium]|nr:MAG: HPr family phosphocarrier protein [Pseudomonadaceae bacterium]
MPTRHLTIINKLGLHARAAAKFVAVAQKHGCQVQIGKCENTLVDGKSIMQVMMLAASKGTDICICCEGDQAEQALEDLECLINNYFDEGE